MSSITPWSVKFCCSDFADAVLAGRWCGGYRNTSKGPFISQEQESNWSGVAVEPSTSKDMPSKDPSLECWKTFELFKKIENRKI